MKEIVAYDYPKQFILNEEEGTKIYRSVGEDEGSKEIDDYQFTIVSTITEKYEDGIKYTQIQHEDERLGWINLQNSIQLFRFKAKSYKFIAEDFEANEINDKLNIVKDFKTHFSGKMVTVKSEIEYKGNKLLSVFVKDKFFGFHDEAYFEELIPTKIKLDHDDLKGKSLYKISSMEKPYLENVAFNKPRLVSIFKESKVGRIRANKKEYFWITIDGLEKYLSQVEAITRTESDKHLDDLFYAIEKERDQSKEAVKTVLSAQSFLNSKRMKEKDKRIQTLQNSFNRANQKIKELESGASSKSNVSNEEIARLKKENHRLSQEVKLSEKRLEQQRDYNRRLEAQKDKYKDRMLVVEEKLKKLSK